jgi:hypothetical protein
LSMGTNPDGFAQNSPPRVEPILDAVENCYSHRGFSPVSERLPIFTGTVESREDCP